MNKTYLMAVDLGTSLIKAGLYNLEGTCLARADGRLSGNRPFYTVSCLFY